MSSTGLKRFLTIVWDNLKSTAVMAVVLVIVMTSIGQTYRIPSSSMEDTLLIGDFVIANKVIYGSRIPFTDWRLPAVRDPQPGDIVIFEWPGDKTTPYIKRCIAVENQVVEIRDKTLYVDGVEFPDPIFSKHIDENIIPRRFQDENSRDNWGPYRVPEDCFFMMGDNRDNSYDSRFWGPVHRKFIIGRAMVIHWSWKEDTGAPEVKADDPLSVPRLFLYNIAHFPERIRWARLLNIVD